MQKNLFHLRFLAFMAGLLLTPAAWPQASTGTVNGTVRDQSEAAVPGAAVTLTNAATAVSAATRTNQTGYYAFPAVIPGTYRLSVEAPGMESYQVQLTVQVGHSAVIDPVLRPGQTLTTIEVRDVTPLVTADSGSLRTTVDHERIKELPINGRTMGALMLALPGVEGSLNQNGGTFRSFGLSTYSNDAILDGISITDRNWGNLYFFSVSPGLGGVQEFTVDSNALSAKMSRPSNIILSSKSGSNQIHGELRETIRNNSISGARKRQDYYQKAPKLIRNEFGGNIGGPLVIPKLYNGKNRTFWFFNYEGQRYVTNSTVDYAVPTAAMRNGDFSELRDAQGRQFVLYDPWTTDTRTWARQPFSYGGKLNVIDPSRISPLAKYLFSITPLPTENTNPVLGSNWWDTVRVQRVFNSWNSRIDHSFSDRDQFYASVYYNSNPFTQFTNLPFTNEYSGWRWQIDGLRTAAAHWVHAFSPAFFNEIVAGARYAPARLHAGNGPTVPSKDWFAELGLPNPFGYKDFPQVTGTGLSKYTITNVSTGGSPETNYTFDDNATLIRGKHELLFGVHLRKALNNYLQTSGDNRTSAVTFNTLATMVYDQGSTPTNPIAKPQTGHNLGNMFLGVATYEASLVPDWLYYREGEAALYFQDNIRVTSRLKLNLGLRWEYWQPWREKNNRITGFDRADHAVVLGTELSSLYGSGRTLPSVVGAYENLGLKFKTWKDANLPQNLMYPQSRNFAPRLGFAYRVFDGGKSLMIRGGYSLSYFSTYVQTWYPSQIANTPLTATFNYLPNDSAQSPDGLGNYGLRSVPAYVAGVNSSQVLNLAQPRGITRGSAQAVYFDPNLPTSRVHAWNLTIEKELMASTVARLRYVGNWSNNLNQFYEYNGLTSDYVWYVTTGQPTPTGEYSAVARRFYDQQVLGNVREYRNTGYARNQALEGEVERRFQKGVAFQLSYAITNSLATTGTVSEINQYLPGAVPTDYDERNRFLNYRRDTGVPKHSVKWNWMVELPVGRGKRVLGNAGRVLNGVIGGWSLAGLGNLRSNYFALPTKNFTLTGEPIEIYGYKYPIQDCHTGTCVPGYLWWNGYIPANQINSRDAQGRPNGYEGIPANYKPAVTPLIPWGSTTLPPNAEPNTNVSQFWDTNTVWVPLKSGKVQRLNYNPGLHPWQNQFLPSVRQWTVAASLSKTFPVYERMKLRFTADFMNVFNNPNNPNTVGGDGFLNCRNSGVDPRVLQLGLMLSW